MTLKEITKGILSEGVSNDEINNAINNLSKCKNNVDLIFTHELNHGTIWQK
mgnify:CR=1 FL=1